MRLSHLLLFLVACGGDKDETVGPVGTDDTGSTTDPTTIEPTTPQPLAFCEPLAAAAGDVVQPTDDLAAKVAQAASGATLLLAPGTHAVSATLVLDKPITLRSEGDDPAAVTIDMAYASGHLIEVQSSDVTLAHLTLSRSGDALVHVAPQASSVLGLRLHDLRLVDAAGVAVVVDPSADETAFADDGEISCSQITLTDAGRGEVLGLCDIGGIDVMQGRDWVVRDNLIDGLWCERGLPNPGIRFGRGSRDVLVHRNQLVDSPTGIVMGESIDKLGRRYTDDPCGDDFAQAIDGAVVNNLISAWRDELVFDSTEGVFAGIRVESSCQVRVLHNTVAHRVSARASSIEHRFPLTSGILANNLVSDGIRRFDDSVADVEGNMEQASDLNWFFPLQGDFHLAPAAIDPIDAGSSAFLGEVPDDIDGQPRSDPPDVGADERF